MTAAAIVVAVLAFLASGYTPQPLLLALQSLRTLRRSATGCSFCHGGVGQARYQSTSVGYQSSGRTRPHG